MGANATPVEKVVTIAGMKFGVSPLMGREGLRVARRLAKSILPAIGSGLVATTGGKSSAERAGRLGQVLERFAPSVFDDLTEAELDSLADRLLANVVYIEPASRQEVLPLVDLLFRGRTLAYLELLWASVSVSYADFFGGSLGAWARAAGAKMKEEMMGRPQPPEPSSSPSPTT